MRPPKEQRREDKRQPQNGLCKNVTCRACSIRIFSCLSCILEVLFVSKLHVKASGYEAIIYFTQTYAISAHRKDFHRRLGGQQGKFPRKDKVAELLAVFAHLLHLR